MPNLLSNSAYSGETPLIHAIRTGDRQSMLLMLGAGADPNERGEDGTLPLHAALWSRSIDLNIVAELLQHQANPNIRGKSGASAGEIVIKRLSHLEKLRSPNEQQAGILVSMGYNPRQDEAFYRHCLGTSPREERNKLEKIAGMLAEAGSFAVN